ncbi:MAG: hypothetical protein WC760_05645 [Bacteroidia bacterium]|jgi:hypothetical protein
MKNLINRLSEIAPLFDEFYLIREPSEIRTKESEKIKQPLNYFGGFESQILMLVNSLPDLDHTDREMLNNLVEKAIKITWDKVALLNLAKNQDYSVLEIMNELNPKKTIIWGCDEQPDELTGGPKYQVAIWKTGEVLRVEGPEAYRSNSDNKRMLWEQIQILLALK